MHADSVVIYALIRLLILEDSADLTADQVRRIVAPPRVVKNGRWMPWNYWDMLEQTDVTAPKPTRLADKFSLFSDLPKAHCITDCDQSQPFCL